MARPRECEEAAALDAAMDCFWKDGYEATSVRDLPTRMGITGASLYNAFGDKRALFREVLQRYAERSTRERIAALERYVSGPSVEELIADERRTSYSYNGRSVEIDGLVRASSNCMLGGGATTPED